MKIGCVILAGGKSSRMGKDKALLQIENQNFITRLCKEFSFFNENIISRGNRERIANVTWPMMEDIYPEHGPIGGLHTALTRCMSEALFCVTCDMPFLKREVYDLLKEEMKPDVDVVIAVTEDGRVHPLCGIYRKHVGDFMEKQILCGNNKLMHVIEKVRVRYVNIRSVQAGLFNINTPEDYMYYCK